MLRLSLLSLFFGWALIAGGQSRPTPRDVCTSDSLLNAMPGVNHREKAVLLLDAVTLLWDSLPGRAYQYIQMAQRIAIQHNHCDLKARAVYLYGCYFEHRRNYATAQKNLLRALDIATICGDTAMLYEILSKIADLSISLTNYPKAEEYYRRGAALAVQSGNLFQLARFKNTTAVALQHTGDTAGALRNYNAALALFEAVGNQPAAMEVIINKGGLLMDQRRFQEALDLLSSLLLKDEVADSVLLGVLYTRIAHGWQQLKQYRMALGYDLRALAVRRKMGYPLSISSSMINVASDYFLLDRADSGEYYIKHGLDVALRYNMRNLVQNAYRHLYEYYERTGNYQKALEYYSDYAAIGLAIEEERTVGNLQVIEANQALQRMQESGKMLAVRQRIQKLASDNQQYQYHVVETLAVVMVVTLLLFVAFYFYNLVMENKLKALNLRLKREIGEREQAGQQLGSREKQYRFLADNSYDFITRYDARTNRVYASPASERIYGYPPEEMISKSPYDITHPDWYRYCEGRLREMVETRSERRLTYQAVKKDGTIIWIDSVLNPMFHPDTGAFIGVVGVNRDISERKAKETEILEATRQSENLLKEIHHRVKNNFAILVSLISMQLVKSDSDTLTRSLTNLQLRIRTLALVHEMLYRSHDFEKISFSEYLHTLTAMISGTFSRRGVGVIFEADDALMDIETLIPLGLIVNELISNAYKHAMAGRSDGRLWVTFSRDAGAASGRLSIRDDGPGLPSNMLPPGVHGLSSQPSGRASGTMGLQIVDLLCQQLEARLEITNDPGASFTVIFPFA